MLLLYFTFSKVLQILCLGTFQTLFSSLKTQKQLSSTCQVKEFLEHIQNIAFKYKDHWNEDFSRDMVA